MKRALLITFAAALGSAVVLSAALAEGSMSDPAGDAGDAPDITGIQVSNDSGGTILFRVTVSNLTRSSLLALMLDTDKNFTTGDQGREYRLIWDLREGRNGGYFERWDGTKWFDTRDSTVRGTQTAAGVEFSINKSDLGGASDFTLKAMTVRFVAGSATATDLAPDGLASWSYYAAPPAPLPPVPVAVSPVFGSVKTVPSKPVAGKKLVFALTVNRSDTGAPLTTGTITCDPSVAGKVLKHTESFKNGKARLALVVPKTAKGKLLKIKVKITNAGQSATKVVTYKVI
jgi:hypothetical protein